jgi:hypothetical protein
MLGCEQKGIFNDNIGFFQPILSPSMLGCEEKIFNDNIGFLHPMLSPSTLGCEKKLFLMTMLGLSLNMFQLPVVASTFLRT